MGKSNMSHHTKFLEAIKKFKHVKDKELGKGLVNLTMGLFLMQNKKK
jgi:hypothetical protein